MTAKDELHSRDDLMKLTVPLLKALCKEKKISGYSKLGKQALIQKLVQASCSSGNSLAAAPCPLVSDSPSLFTSKAVDVVTKCNFTYALPHGSMLTDGDRSASNGPSLAISLRTAAPAQRKGESSALKVPLKRSSKPLGDVISVSVLPSGIVSHAGAPSSSALTNNVPSQAAEQSVFWPAEPLAALTGGSYRDRNARENIVTNPGLDVNQQKRKIPSDIPSTAKRPRIQPRTTSIQQPQLGSQLNAHDSARKHPQSGSSVVVDSSQPFHASPVATSTTCSATPSFLSHTLPKRFKPLVVDKSKLPCQTPVCLSSAAAAAKATQPHDGKAPPQDLAAPLYYLDLPISLTPVPILRPISLPPPLAQRKRVAAWAVILSGLSDAERAVCALVSRTFRYAVYLSATSILNRDFCGRRLQDVSKQYSQAMTNMWPYLHLRNAEMTRCQRIYEASFVARFFRRCGYDNPITQRLWTSPDNQKQLVIAIRFALTRMWFELSVGTSSGTKEDPDTWLNGTISDVQEVVESEIWLVSLVYPSSTTRARKQEMVYVLEATCEVIGRLPESLRDEHVQNIATIPLRADWFAYVAERSARSSDDASLLSRLKWSCHEEYDRGMSRLWLKRIAQEGEVGLVKRSVAERYILACVVSNSISGPWMTAHAMAQDFAGLASRTGLAKENKKAKAVNLYLPEHHHVESVHFATPRGEPLHPALATVQTPHREYFILRDNGMQVGCDEEGVAAIWQEVLECDHIGKESSA
ncbi:hypothetical protein C8Q70DRAFT_910108 [Cubamyces menziesii]|nr:hypothetical protein C8Q70DRAFT_910108 [Cubamyces menziesii]